MMESHFDEVLDVYRPLPNLSSFSEILQADGAALSSYLPHPVFLPNRLKSKDVLMMQHREHVEEVQNFVLPLSPSLHSPIESS